MTPTSQVIEKFNALPPEGQRQVLELIEALGSTPIPEAVNGDAANTSIWKRLSALGREMEQLPTELPADLAKNHDHYLHGTPKRS